MNGLPLSRHDLRNGVILSTILLMCLQGLSWLGETPFSWGQMFIRWIGILLMLLVARIGQPYLGKDARLIWPWIGLLALAVLLCAGGVYGITGATSAAVVLLGSFWVVLLHLQTIASRRTQPVAPFVQIILFGLHTGLLALAGGIIPFVIAQIASRFADEEFFIALQALALSCFCMLLLAGWAYLWPITSAHAQPGLYVRRRQIVPLLGVLTIVGILITIDAYQHSFYPDQAPDFADISPATPFVCGVTTPVARTHNGIEVFQHLLARVAANPVKHTAEYGMLALGSGEQRWAQAFREHLLQEVATQEFTQPANSVKSVQHAAAMRAYYYPRVHAAFPGLFTPNETQQIEAWFTAINQRSMTIEWVDWMYALAFRQWPEAPYANQETGAALLTLLENEDLAAPALTAANQAFLAQRTQGWADRFRNTDDAHIYQPEWITNAFFQSLATNTPSTPNVGHSFEWLLLQALPDGAPLRYNHPYGITLPAIAYLGAQLTGDDRYLWLAGEALTYLDTHSNGVVFAQPGVEHAIARNGTAPGIGSCLLYGDSGLPYQAGPLAPDKIVFRTDWNATDPYALLNLRFSGWHRYKATNTITLIYQGTPLVIEAPGGTPFRWLPEGRSFFRDKRIPREHLNGLLIQRTGMSRVLQVLTGFGSSWAQDPPYYARVARFETGAIRDVSSTVIENWHGWQHRRDIYFYHHGPMIVVDHATGPTNQRSALVWHIQGQRSDSDQRFQLGHGQQTAEMHLLALDNGTIHGEDVPAQQDQPGLRVRYDAGTTGELSVITLFLLNEWHTADIELTRQGDHLAVHMTQGNQHMILPLD